MVVVDGGGNRTEAVLTDHHMRTGSGGPPLFFNALIISPFICLTPDLQWLHFFNEPFDPLSILKWVLVFQLHNIQTELNVTQNHQQLIKSHAIVNIMFVSLYNQLIDTYFP